MKNWAVRMVTCSPSPLTKTPKELETYRVIKAKSKKEAVEKAIKLNNMWDLKYGVAIDVAPINWEKADRVHAQYARGQMAEVWREEEVVVRKRTRS